MQQNFKEIKLKRRKKKKKSIRSFGIVLGNRSLGLRLPRKPYITFCFTCSWFYFYREDCKGNKAGC